MVTVIVVFTRKGPNRILLDGGTSSWKLDPKRAGDCDYVVCTRNEDGGAGHGAAFLIGKVGEPVPTGANRYLITITAYALVNIPGVWR
jgi:hypothetical protein